MKMKLLKILLSNLRRQLWTLVNQCYLYFQNAKVGKNFSTNGFVYVKNCGCLEIGDNVKINSGLKYNPIGGINRTSLVVRNGAKLTIGDNCGISNAAFFCSKEICVDSNVIIGGDTRVYDTDFHSIVLKDRLVSPEQNVNMKKVKIKSGAFIGASSIILKGVLIGEESVVGCGAVVSGKEIGSREIWAGNPAIFIRKVC